MCARWFEVHRLLQLSVSSHLCVPTLSMSQNKFTAAHCPLPTPGHSPQSGSGFHGPASPQVGNVGRVLESTTLRTTHNSHRTCPLYAEGQLPCSSKNRLVSRSQSHCPASHSQTLLPCTRPGNHRSPVREAFPVERGLATIYSHQWPSRPRGPTEWPWGY